MKQPLPPPAGVQELREEDPLPLASDRRLIIDLRVIPGSHPTNGDMQRFQIYRAITCYFVAALLKGRGIRFTNDALTQAMQHLDACDENPSFRIERYSGGRCRVSLIHPDREPSAWATIV